jgi:hypothetical protein
MASTAEHSPGTGIHQGVPIAPPGITPGHYMSPSRRLRPRPGRIDCAFPARPLPGRGFPKKAKNKLICFSL